MVALIPIVLLAATHVFALVIPGSQGAQGAQGAPALPPVRVCSERLQRKAWHTLTPPEKKAFISAELCLMSQPSRSKLGAAVTLYDDLNKAHQLLTLNVHFDGWFLPWHRYFVHAHEQLLRRVCGYRGAHPWWDETREAGHYSTGAVFNAASFGGNGTISGMPGTPEGQRCISDGPFKDYRYAVGPGMNDTEIPRCITRHLNDTFSMGAQQSEVDKCYAMTNYDTASTCLWGRPHVAGHRATGGEGLNIFSSPGDPTFYIHHAFIDRLWWNWQQRDLPKRLNELSGYTTFIEPITGWVNATMDDEMSVFGVHPNATIRQMMDVRGWPSCAEYVEPPAE